MNRRLGKLIIALFVAATVVAIPGAGAAELEIEPVDQPKVALLEGNPDLAKVSSDLLQVRKAHAAGRTAAPTSDEVLGFAYAAGNPELDLRLTKVTDGVVAAAEAIGFQTTGAFPQFGRMTGTIDPAQYDELAAIAEITTIHPNYGAQVNVGSTTSQADSSINADLARTTFGVDGSGMTVGVISDTFHRNIGGTLSGSGCNQTLTGSSPQLSNDLPASLAVLEPGEPTGIDEGAGMAELIHDLAPGADLMFHSAFISEADFAAGITELADCGADVIVDDVIYFIEPFFQDGIIADAAQSVVEAGVPYYSSAGNQAGFGVRETYKDVQPTVDDTTPGDDFHNWGGGNRYASIELDAGEAVRLVLQWDQPHSGTQGPGAAVDLDLYVCSSPNPADCTSGSTNFQGCTNGTRSGDPLEHVLYQNLTGTTETVYMAVDHWCGSQSGVDFRIATYGANVDEHDIGWDPTVFNQAQIYGHAAAEDVIAVGAVYYREIDLNGTYEPPNGRLDVEPFSSSGGQLPFYFDAAGNPLPGAPVDRFKPEIAAPDGTNTTFFGSDSDGDGFPNFFGTSAAAPHAAAVAALILDAKPNLSPAAVNDILRATAIDIETAGVDKWSGDGLIDAFDAVAVADAGGLCFGAAPTKPFTSGNDVIQGTSGDDVLMGGGGNDTIIGAGGNDKICGGDGADLLDGGNGNDRIHGNKGTDRITYSSANKSVTVDLPGKSASGHGSDKIYSVENVTGGAFDDNITGTTGKNSLIGGDGVDEIDGGGGKDTLKGGDGNDTLIGGAGNDTLVGGANNDVLLPGAGDDSVLGGNGADTVSYQDSPSGVTVNLFDNLAFGYGDDTIDGVTKIKGSPRNDKLRGDGVKNDIWGLGGHDLIDGKSGNDRLYGQAGNDTILGKNGNDKLIGGSGTGDDLNGGSGTDTCKSGETYGSCELPL